MQDYCENCDAERIPGGAFCYECGHSFEPRTKKRRRKRQREAIATDDSSPNVRIRRGQKAHGMPADDRPAEDNRRTTKKQKRPSNRPETGTVLAPTDDPERELWSDTYSAKGLVNYWLALIAASLILPVLAVTIDADSVAWQALIVIIGSAWCSVIGWLVLLKLDVHYVLTNQRFLHKSGILTRHTKRIEVIDIDDISFRQGIIERLLNVGTIEIISSDRSDPIFELDGIDNVHEVAHIIDEARRAERVRRGLHIESV